MTYKNDIKPMWCSIWLSSECNFSGFPDGNVILECTGRTIVMPPVSICHFAIYMI